MSKRGRKKEKYAINRTFFIRTEVSARINKMADGKPSQLIERLVNEEYEKKKGELGIAEKEAQEILGGALNEHNSLLSQ